MISEYALKEIERHSYMLSEPENQAGQTLRLLIKEIRALRTEISFLEAEAGYR